MWCDAGVRSMLSDALWTTLLSLGTARTYGMGERLLTEGELDTRVIVILDGRVKVMCAEEDGSETLLAIRGTGDVVGERSAIDGGPRSATVTALRRCSTRVLMAHEFMRFLQVHNLLDAMLRLSVSRQREAQLIRVEISTLPIRRRLIRTLVRLVEAVNSPTGGPVTLDLGIGQEELARAIGASRSQIAIHLARLRDARVLSTSRRRIIVLDPARLRVIDEGHTRM
jgi:CRP/FNR family cyclic AMP-dependent transcriptional regulator